jgi:hypothetical protein
MRANPITPPLINHFRIIAIRRERGARMNSPCAPSLWRGFQLFLGKQASLPACFGQLVFWLIVTGFSLITSPPLFAQINDNTAPVSGRIAGQARTPALPGDGTTVHGRVTDMSGAVVAGASVTLGNLATGLERVVTTDAKCASRGRRSAGKARENWKIQWVRRLSKTANKGGAEAPA